MVRKREGLSPMIVWEPFEHSALTGNNNHFTAADSVCSVIINHRGKNARLHRDWTQSPPRPREKVSGWNVLILDRAKTIQATALSLHPRKTELEKTEFVLAKRTLKSAA